MQIESYHALDSDSDTESDEMKEESEIKVKREPGTGTDSKALSFQDLKRQQDRHNKKSDPGKPQFISEPYRPNPMKREVVQFRLPPNVGPATNHQIQVNKYCNSFIFSVLVSIFGRLEITIRSTLEGIQNTKIFYRENMTEMFCGVKEMTCFTILRSRT